MILVTVPDAAHIAEIPLRTLYRWVADGHVTALRRGPRSTLVDLDEVIDYAGRVHTGLTPPDHGT